MAAEHLLVLESTNVWAWHQPDRPSAHNLRPAEAQLEPGRLHQQQQPRLAGGGRGNGCRMALLLIGTGSQEEFLPKKRGGKKRSEWLGVLIRRGLVPPWQSDKMINHPTHSTAWGLYETFMSQMAPVQASQKPPLTPSHSHTDCRESINIYSFQTQRIFKVRASGEMGTKVLLS